MNRSDAIAIVFLLAGFAVGAYFYPQLPDVVASHWNAAGEADGYMPRAWGLFLLPAISVALYALLRLLPRLDPLRANVAAFRRHYDAFIVVFIAFMLYLHLLTIAWNIGLRFNMIQWLCPAFGALFYGAGVLVGHAKRNWFIGIRTPWTLSSDAVWDKTHRLGGRLFRAAGALALVSVVLPGYAIWFVMAPVIVAALWAAVYSYVEYRRQAA